MTATSLPLTLSFSTLCLSLNWLPTQWSTLILVSQLSQFILNKFIVCTQFQTLQQHKQKSMWCHEQSNEWVFQLWVNLESTSKIYSIVTIPWYFSVTFIVPWTISDVRELSCFSVTFLSVNYVFPCLTISVNYLRISVNYMCPWPLRSVNYRIVENFYSFFSIVHFLANRFEPCSLSWFVNV